MFRTQQSSSTLLMGPAGTSWFWASRPMAGKRKHQIDGGEGGGRGRAGLGWSAGVLQGEVQYEWAGWYALHCAGT